MNMKKTLLGGAVAAVVSLGATAFVADVAHADALDARGAVFRFGYDGQVINDAADLGSSLPEGSSIHYVAVGAIDGTTIDGVVTFVEGTNLYEDKIDRIDDELPDDEEDPFIESNIFTIEAAGASAVVNVAFYVTGTYTGVGTGTPVTLTNLSVNFYDIDDGQSIDVTGIAGYSLSTNTIITATAGAPGAYRFEAANEDTDDEDGTARTRGRVRIVYASVSSITYTLMMPSDGGGGYDVDISDGLPWTDDFDGAEDVSNLPQLPATGSSALVMSLIAAGLLAAGVTLTRVRRTAA